MTYYIGIGSDSRAEYFWNRKKGAYQPFRCMDCVYPTFRGANRVYQQITHGAHAGWRDALNHARDCGVELEHRPKYWLVAQGTVEAWDKGQKGL